MGSTGESDRKRRHVSSISSTVAAPAKKSLSSPRPDDRKLDPAVLQFQNQKLVQQLETQSVEYSVIATKFDQQKEKQKNYDETLVLVQKSWEQLINDLESLSICPRSYKDGGSCTTEDEFLCRLAQSGATECCSAQATASQTGNDGRMVQEVTRSILQNVVSAITDLRHVNNQLSSELFQSLAEDDQTRELKGTVLGWQAEVKSLWSALDDLHLKHRSLANEMQVQRDTKAKLRAEQKHLEGELESTCKDLKENKAELSVLKAQRDTGQGTPFLFPTLGNSRVGDKVKDKEKELHDLEIAKKELMELASTRLLDIKRLHEKRLEDLNKLSTLQNTLNDVHDISSSKAYGLLSELLEKAKHELNQHQVAVEELQVEKDKYLWREKEVTLKLDLAEASRGSSTVAESRIGYLESELHKLDEERVLLETKLKEASREPERKEVIGDFRALLSSLPKDMDTIQSQISKYKEESSEIHSLRAKVLSLTNNLNRKENEVEALFSKSANHISEIERLQAVVRDLEESDRELKLFVEMYKRECTDSRDISECRDLEYKAWAHVQSLQYSLDEHSLELRVKAANEAEAMSQQRLATAEAEIADLRQKLEASGRDLIKLAEVLKSKREEGEAYLSEIESIGQAYEDVQNKNQLLLQEITERDDYNIKLAVEGVRARHVQDALRMEIQNAHWQLQQVNASLDSCSQRTTILDDQLKMWSEQVRKLAEDGWQSSVSLENTKRRLVDVQRESQQLRKSLGDMQAKIDMSRDKVSGLHIELEKERFNKKRVEEDLEITSRKASHLKVHTESSSVLGKLQQELCEYKGILKCGICHDRQKEVVIAKCYHLFCHPCVRKTLESRHRKCPACGLSFGPNDVKPIYI